MKAIYLVGLTIFSFAFISESGAQTPTDTYSTYHGGAPAQAVYSTPAPVTADQNAAGIAAEAGTYPKLIIPLKPVVLTEGAEEWKALQGRVAECNSRTSLARGVCLTSMNPKIAAASTAITAILAGVEAMGQKQACEKFGGAMDIAKAAMTAYTAGCGAARLACTMSCENLKRDIGAAVLRLQAKAAAYTEAGNTTGASAASTDAKRLGEIAEGELKMPSDPSTSLLAQCDKYQLKIAAGAMGLVNIIQSAKGGKNCENATASNETSTLDCSKPENAKVVECMCRTNPTLAGCAGAGPGSNDPYQNLAGDYSESSSSSDSNVDLSATPSIDTTSAFGSADLGSGGAAGFNNGGGGQGGIAGNGSGKAADGGKGTGRGLNKNILSGYEGGSGGGKGGAGYSDDGYANQFKAFMPGGEKDPTRNPANAVFAGGQVTGAGSKSNWEKVSERYQANRPTMVGGQ